MKKFFKLKNLILFLFFGFLFLNLSVAKSYAQPETDVYFCSQDGSTIWGIQAVYFESNGKTTPTGGTIPATSWTNQTGNIADAHVCKSSSYTGFTEMSIFNYAYHSGDSVTWHSACVDPNTGISATFVNYAQFGESFYSATVNVTCPSSNSYQGQPASCNGAKNSGKQISASTWCPFGPYCMHAGKTLNTNTCSGAFAQNQVVGTVPSSCTNASSCTYAYCFLSGSFGACGGSKTDTTGAYCGSSCNGCSTNADCGGQYVCGSGASTCNQMNTGCNTTTHKCTTVTTTHDGNAPVCLGKNGCACQTNADCSGQYVCGSGATACHQYDTTCNTTTHQCVQGPSHNSNAPACGSSCPAGPTGSAATFCQGTAGTNRASGITFSWTEVPYADQAHSGQYDIVYAGVNHYVASTTYCNDTTNTCTYSLPAASCTTGPGGCSFNYNASTPWYVYANSGTVAGDFPTQHSPTYTTVTQDCSPASPPPTNCNTGAVCGVCSVSCGGGTQSCTYTQKTGGGACTQVPAPSQSCNNQACSTPNCNSGITCGACSVSCGGGTQACTYTTLSGGGSCTQVPAPSQSCNNQACVCNAPASPSGPTPSGEIAPGTRNVTWGAVSGVTDYALRIDDESTPWAGNCGASQYGGDVCDDSVTGTSYSYNFQSGHSYHIWVQAIAACGTYSNSSESFVDTTSSITVRVYLDPNGNSTGTSLYTGGNTSIQVTGEGAGTYSIGSTGIYTLSGVLGTSTIRLINLPAGYVVSATDTNPKVIDTPPSQPTNFYMQAVPPTCTSFTANPMTVNPGETSNITVGGCPAGVTYTYFPDTVTPGLNDAITNDGDNTATWSMPSPYYNDIKTYPTVQVCFPATGVCSNYGFPPGGGIHVVPQFSIDGAVFVDANKDHTQNNGEGNYTSLATTDITISPKPVDAVVSVSNGTFHISNVDAGTYTIIYNGPPTGYELTYPQNSSVPPSFQVTVGNASTGTPCKIAGTATCDASGNITALKYGITNSIPWIQSTGGDITGDNITTAGGITDVIPNNGGTPAVCGGVTDYASVAGVGGTPGVINAGASGDYFCPPLECPDRASNAGAGGGWIVGGQGGGAYTYSLATPGVVRTSYSQVLSVAKQSNINNGGADLGTAAGGCNNFNACALGALASGVYIADTNLTLTGATYTVAPNKNYVILVDGDLTINTKIVVPTTSTLLFSVSGDIHVGSNVGEASITTACNVSTNAGCDLGGWYSADGNFIIDSKGTGVTDLRLNIAGAVVVDAALGGGTFQNNRDLYAGDLTCPAVSISERPDFVLNAPGFLLSPRRIWREVAP